MLDSDWTINGSVFLLLLYKKSKTFNNFTVGNVYEDFSYILFENLQYKNDS